MVLGKKWLFSIWNWATIRPLEKGRKKPENSKGYIAVRCAVECVYPEIFFHVL